MNPKEIRSKYLEIKQKLKDFDAQQKMDRLLITAEIVYLQHVCSHEDHKSWSDNCAKMPSNYWECKTCGLYKST